MHALLVRALGSRSYERTGYTSHVWDVSGRCQSPQTRELVSTPLILGRYRYGGMGETPQRTLIMKVRCRMCDCCRRLKAALWTARAEAEVTTGPRNWFGTLTLSPAMHYQIVTRCRVRLRSGGTDFDSLSESEQFAERMTEIGREVTLWLKRIRKEAEPR